MHHLHREQDVLRPSDGSHSHSWHGQHLREVWSEAAPRFQGQGNNESNTQFLDFSSPYNSVFEEGRGNGPSSTSSDLGHGAGSAYTQGDVSAAMHRLVEASLGTKGHQGAADYVRYTLHHGAMGYCAGGVEEAIRRAGLGDFHADAHNLDELLAKSPLWQEVHVDKNQLKSLPPGYVVVMENKDGRQHSFISDGHGMESSDWHGSVNMDQLLPLVMNGKAQYRVFRPAGDGAPVIPDAVPDPPPDHRVQHHHHHHQQRNFDGASNPGSGGSDSGGSSGSSGDGNSGPSEESWIDPNGSPDSPPEAGPNQSPEPSPTPPPDTSDQGPPESNLPIGDPNQFFLNQFRSKFNPDGLPRSEDCGPTSLAMFMLHCHKFPPGANPADTAELIKSVRKAMTGSTRQSGTGEWQIQKAAAAAGIHSHHIDGMAGLNAALAKGEMVVACGNPGAPGSYGNTLSNSQYSHFNGAHFILVVGHEGDHYTINDPLSRTGSRTITAGQMAAYMQGLGGKGSGVALSP